MDAWDYSDAYFLKLCSSQAEDFLRLQHGGHILDKRDDTALANHYQNTIGRL